MMSVMALFWLADLEKSIFHFQNDVHFVILLEVRQDRVLDVVALGAKTNSSCCLFQS